MPPQAGGERSEPERSGGDLATLGRYVGKAGKKAAEMGRFFLQVNGCVNQEHRKC